ncbi:P22 phage major capsid protein family protein [Clostridium perfringens]|uniref:P22 phage major capsid protein family protein n=1 Tax=Clostridium perfringens TaxID=1502 RepID=UPI000D8C8344|nr:P22 phage major capsid protein family protein [Clostridium perfringens]EHK2355234.1 P22 coat protein - protein 5 domain protein [Clostridium perfringens]CAG9359077.1 P22 coat protein - gene protein 5 [Clostridium perfringens]SQB35262.1 P22 coat protein - gene protein 5 [Clostridium perfringens]HAT4156642.1 P22 coat protein - protein 5 domain protein [Clostridium perfringens]
MSVKNFIPQIWSARLLANLDKNLVYANAVNRDYEGEIKKFGDTVKINQMGDVTVKDYKGGVIEDPEELNSNQTILTIDQAKYFNFKVDDVDKAQANVTLVDKGMGRASYAVQDVIDKFIAALVKDAKIKVGNTSKPVEITVANAYDTLVDLGVELDNKNVPRVGRFVILPPFYLGLLSKDPRFTKDFKILENGVVDGATVSGFKIMMSNNVPFSANNYSIMAGIDMAISFAGQVTEVEAYRPEKSFSDAMKGLYVFGAKVTQPDCLACLTAKQKVAEE